VQVGSCEHYRLVHLVQMHINLSLKSQRISVSSFQLAFVYSSVYVKAEGLDCRQGYSLIHLAEQMLSEIVVKAGVWQRSA